MAWQLKSYQPGGTQRFLSAEDLNRLQNGMFVNGKSCGRNIIPKSAIDYSYIPSFASRKKIVLSEVFDDFDVFKLGKYFISPGKAAYYMFGWYCIIEYFDDNVLIDVMQRYDSDAPDRDEVINTIAVMLATKYYVTIIGDNRIINIKQR